MPIPTNSGVPCSIEAGTTVKFSLQDSEFPADEWALTFIASRDGAKKIEKAAEVEEGKWIVTIGATETQALLPGVYDFACYAVKGEEKARVESGRLTIEPNLAIDRPKTTAETMLANIEAAIAKLSSGTNQSTNFNGQTFTKKDLSKLLEDRDKLRAEVQGERAASGGVPNWKTIVTRL